MKVFGVVGWKNAGKTGLMERLVAEICERGLTVSAVKHAHHVFDVDQPGKDSFRHRQAGASEVMLSSRNRVALMQELRGTEEPSLEALLARLLAHSVEERFVYKHRWAPNMLTLWDNRSVQHFAQGGYDGYRRVLHRTIVAGDKPY